MTHEIDLTHTDEIPHGFALEENGLFEVPSCSSKDPIFVCTPISVVAAFSDPNSKNWGKLVSVRADDGTEHEVRVGRAELHSKPADVIRRLLDCGVELAPETKSKDRLISFLKASRPAMQLVLSDHSGWLNDQYRTFLAGKSAIGNPNARSKASETEIGGAIATRGNLEDWKANVGSKCCGNPLMILAASLALSGPLLQPLGLQGGGLHFRGASSTGKTTLLNLAASVWGNRGIISQWRATTSGLEALAPAMNGMLLPLDEIAEITPRALHDAIYMLANGKGKTRMTRDATMADTAKWRLSLISSGEISIQEKLAEGRLDVRAGHEVRLIDIEADTRAFGAFDNLHGAEDAAIFANSIQAASQSLHGSVGVEFVTRLVSAIVDGKHSSIVSTVQKLAQKWTSCLNGVADGQVERVAQRFAVIGVAGFLATKWDLTGWASDEAIKAAEEAFHDWHQRRYSDKFESGEEFARPLQKFVASNLNSFVDLNGTGHIGNTASGWFDESRVYLSPTTWTSLFPGAEAPKAAKTLLDMGILVSDGGGRLTRRAPRSIPRRPRLYTLMSKRLKAIDASR
jgi:putative DNA primase/helicase